MTSAATSQAIVRRFVTLSAGVVATALLTMFSTALTPVIAHADPAYLDYSADGTNWGGIEQIPALSGDLVPGSEATSTFHARNGGTEGGRLQLYLGNWEKSENMQAYVRAEINDSSGEIIDLVNDLAQPGTELNSIHLAPGESAKVMLVVGVPEGAGEESTGGSVDPKFALDFTFDPAAVATSVAISGGTSANNGTNVKLTATVVPNSATGTVQFRDNGAVLGGPVPLVGGVAEINRAFTVDGEHIIVAEYLGDATHAPSVSALHVVTVSSVAPEPGGAGSSGSLDSGSLGGLLGG